MPKTDEMKEVFYKLSTNSKRSIAVFYDCFVVLFSFPMAIFLRYGELDPQAFSSQIWLKVLLVVSVHLLTFLFFRQYKGLWRYASLHDLVLIIKTSTFGVLISLSFLFLTGLVEHVPRTSFVIQWAFNIIFLAGGRFVYRMLKDRTSAKMGDRCLIVGAGYGGNHLIKSIDSSPESYLTVVGVLDDDPIKQGRSIQGHNILGPTSSLAHWINKLGVQKVIIAIPSASSSAIRRILDHIPKDDSLKIKILPSMSQIASEEIDYSYIKDIDPVDLLGRRPVNLNLSEITSFITNKCIMVTGAGGSIGHELCKQIASFNPEKIILFEMTEFSLYECHRKLQESYPSVEIIPCIGNVMDELRLNEMVLDHRPDIVFHAAAYKHVPLMEISPREAIKNNVIGTRTLLEVVTKNEVPRFVMISTDKAVNPTNFMGATKRIAEMMCQHYSTQSSSTKFSIVRFGNVLGSAGSVVPLFKEQIKAGGPVTVTHKDITRYFMSIPEACQLVLQAASLGRGGDIFVLEMGEPVKVAKLAEEMISHSGFEPYKDIEIKFTGLRPGEKLYEELFNQSERIRETEHDMVKSAEVDKLPDNFITTLNSLCENIQRISRYDLIKHVKTLVHGFRPDFYDEGQGSSTEDLH